MRKKRILTITGLVFLGLTLLLVLGGILLYSFTPVIDNAILALVNRLGQDNIHLSYKNLSGNLFNRIRVDEMTLTFGSDSLTADRIELNYSLLDVVRGDYRVDDVDIEGPRLTLDITPDSTAQDTAAFSINALLDKLNPASLPRLEIGNLNLTDGQVKLTNGEKTEILDQIGLEMAGFLKPDSVRLEPVTLKARWQNRDITLDPLRISLTGNERKLRLNRLSANGGKHRLHAHGEVDFEPESRVTLWLDTLNLNVPELGRQVPDFPFKEGQLALSGEVAGNDSGLSGKLQASGKMDYLTLRELRSDFALVGEGYELDNFHLASNVGHVNGKVRLFPKGENTVDVTVNQLDLQAAQLSNDPLLLNGKVDFTFRGFSLDTFRGRGHLSLRNTVVGPARIDRVWLGVYSDGERINFAEDSRVEIAPGSQFRVGGYVTRDLVADLHMVTEDNRLDSLARRLGIENAGGSGDLDLKLSGKLSDPNLEGNLEIDSLYYQDNVIYGIHGKADLSRLATSRRGMFDLEVATGYLGDVFLTSGEMRLTFSKDRIVLNPLQFYTEENSVFCRGYVRMLDNYIYVSLPDLNMKFREYTITNQEALQLHVDQDSLVVEQFKMITSDKGEISAEGFVAFNGESHLIAEIEGLPLAPVDQYLYLDYKLDGMLSRANLFLGGKLDNPEVELGFTVDSLSLDNHYLGILSSDMTLSDHRFNLNNLSFDSPTGGYFSLNGNLDLMLGSEGDSAKARLVDEPLNLSMVFSDLRIQDYAFLYDVNYPLKGTFEGRIDLIGDIDRPRGTINLTGSDLQYQDYIFPSIAIEDGKMTHQEIDIPKALIDFSNTEIRASFKKPISWNPDAPEKLMEDKTFSAEAFVEEDSLNFLGALSPELERLVGDITLDVAVGGTFEEPQITRLKMAVENGTLSLTKLQNPIEKVQLVTEMDPQNKRLNFSTFRALAPEEDLSTNFFTGIFRKVKRLFIKEKESGQIDGRGYVDLSDPLRPRMDLYVSTNRAYVNYFLENTRVAVSTKDLHIFGRDTLNILGDVVVDKGDIQLDFVESEKNLLFTTVVREEAPFLSYEVDVEIPPNLRVRSEEALNNFDFIVSGDLTVRQPPRELLAIYGALNVEGRYYVQGEEFTVEDGKIDFVDPTGLPELDLNAQTAKNSMVFKLFVKGPLDSPENTLQIYDESGNEIYVPEFKDQLALLLFGVRFDELGGNANSLLRDKGENLLTQAVVNRIEQQARSFTGLDQVRLTGQESFFSSRLNQQPSLSLGKYLTPNLYLEYNAQLGASGLGNIPTPQLSWEAGSRVYLQYRLNRNWSFSSIYEKTQEGNDRVKLDVNWQLEF